jgi:hypothetical protein
MSKVEWCPYFHIKEEHPWPDAVHVVRGDERKLYLKERTCHNVDAPPKNDPCLPVLHFRCSECGAMHVSVSDVYFCPNCGAWIVDE